MDDPNTGYAPRSPDLSAYHSAEPPEEPTSLSPAYYLGGGGGGEGGGGTAAAAPRQQQHQQPLHSAYSQPAYLHQRSRPLHPSSQQQQQYSVSPFGTDHPLQAAYPPPQIQSQLHHPQQPSSQYFHHPQNPFQHPEQAHLQQQQQQQQQQQHHHLHPQELLLQQQQQQQSQFPHHHQQQPFPPPTSARSRRSTADMSEARPHEPAKRGRKSKKVKVEVDYGTKPAPGVEEGIEVRTKFPVARIKRIMQADEDVGKVAQVTPTAVSKALELFMISLVTKAAAQARAKSSKKVTAAHLKQVVQEDEQFDFLADIISKVPDQSAAAAAKKDDDSEGGGNGSGAGASGVAGEGGKKRGRGPGKRRRKEEGEDEF